MSANAQKKLRPNIMKPLFGQSWNIRHLPGHLTLREIYKYLDCTKASSEICYGWLSRTSSVSNMLLNTLQWVTLHQRKAKSTGTDIS